MDTRAALGGTTLFGALNDDLVEEIASRGETRSLAAGERVFSAGDEADGLYVVLDGTVRVTCRDEDGEEVELVTLGSGEFFGEMSLFDNLPRSATVACVDDCRFFFLTREPFLELLMRSQDLLIAAIARLSSHIRRDIGQVLEVTVKKRRLQQEMELERLRSLSQMVAGVAHEVNTPLGIANTAASILDRLVREHFSAGGDAGAGTAVADILESNRLLVANVERAHELVRMFKNLSVRQLTDTPDEVCLPGVVTEVVGLFAPSARQAKLEVAIRDTLPSDGRMWFGNPGHLSQVLLNLLKNVERYAYPGGGGGRVEIRIGPHPSGDSVLLEVVDFGAGIPEEDRSSIFDPFFTTGRALGGTGLGLSIVKNLVNDAMGGTIAVRATAGGGATFAVTVPWSLAAGSGDDGAAAGAG